MAEFIEVRDGYQIQRHAYGFLKYGINIVECRGNELRIFPFPQGDLNVESGWGIRITFDLAKGTGQNTITRSDAVKLLQHLQDIRRYFKGKASTRPGAMTFPFQECDYEVMVATNDGLRVALLEDNQLMQSVRLDDKSHLNLIIALQNSLLDPRTKSTVVA